ncbi:MAG TPA: biopolymer transporter ExbD [Gammaproteobacteria bacterium]|nr:biopolymer transporter ExbD [Gammaproteobacteria bacterium]
MMRRSRKNRGKEAVEVNITAFLDIMVVLLSFLLITTVFSRLAILELNLPAAANAAEPPKPELALEVTVRKSSIEVGDRNAGLLKRFPNGAKGYDYDGLGAYLADVKRQFPDKTDATVLLEPDIAYDVLVAVMDKVRVAERTDETTGRTATSELFPEISIGDAPAGP